MAAQPPPKPLPTQNFFARIGASLASKSKEVARALPDSKGGEEPKSLQTYRTEVFTYFTTPGPTELIYSAENWVRIKLTLRTAGPVTVGTRASLTPVNSGKGNNLATDDDYETYLAKGTRFYIAAETVNRITVTVEPIPWLEQLDADGISNTSILRAAIAAAGSSIVSAVSALKTAAPGKSASGKTADQLPPCPPDRRFLPRASRLEPPKKTR